MTAKEIIALIGVYVKSAEINENVAEEHLVGAWDDEQRVLARTIIQVSRAQRFVLEDILDAINESTSLREEH